VEIEGNIERIRTKDNKAIMNEFAEIKRWMNFIFENGSKFDEDKIFQIYSLSLETRGLISRVDKEDERVKEDRDKLEEDLR